MDSIETTKDQRQLVIQPGAVPAQLGCSDWTPGSSSSKDESAIRLALLLAHSPGIKKGTTGCVIASCGGDIVGCGISGRLLGLHAAEHFASEAHSEVQALGVALSRGASVARGTAYVTMAPCRHSFMVLAIAGLRRMVMRKELLPQDSREIKSAAKRLGIELVVMPGEAEVARHAHQQLDPSELEGNAEAASKRIDVESLATEANFMPEPLLSEATPFAGPPPKRPKHDPGTDQPDSLDPISATVPTIERIGDNALPDTLNICGWMPQDSLSGDENGLDLALLLSRNSKCRNGSMGCAIASDTGEVIAAAVNGPFWGSLTAKRPPSDAHAEINALGHCAQRGLCTRGGTAYITMPPCKRCFAALASAGIRRIVSRKEFKDQGAKDTKLTATAFGITLVVVEDADQRLQHIQRLVGVSKRKLEAGDAEGVNDDQDG
eukprot:TRINITY_DN11551_c0_g1_i1.p1 TRINITY_DN11551_c0_g1~~TRINITY_DN11551_c0_g1_i1.p1  ORF type:complete len:435 (-),score=59.55 TRINITY_DN11551_c0_g1_i1:45-1349(-)